MIKEIIDTKNAPAAIGPYSQAIKLGNLLFTSGIIPLDPVSGDLINENITEATKKVLENLIGILNEAGTSLENVIKTVVYLKDMEDFAKVNEIYAQYFISNQPARSCIQVAKLPKDALVEIEAIAFVE